MRDARLQKLVLMLSSDQPGEVAAAANRIGATLRASGRDWHDFARTLTEASATKQNNWRTTLRFCLQHETKLNEREREFLQSLRAWRGAPTAKQRAWLNDIHERLNL